MVFWPLLYTLIRQLTWQGDTCTYYVHLIIPTGAFQDSDRAHGSIEIETIDLADTEDEMEEDLIIAAVEERNQPLEEQ